MMKHFALTQWHIVGAFVFLVAALGGVSWYGYTRIQTLTADSHDLAIHVAALESTLSSTTIELQQGLATTQTSFADRLAQERQAIEDKVGSVQNQVGSISSTVGTLEKLSKTDPELLAKYSKVFFLSENYAPERVAQIPQVYVYSETRPETIHQLVLPRLKAMLDAATAQNIKLYIKSAYRSFDEQLALKSSYTVVYGAGTANQFSADQGYSEHQLGTTADFITSGLGGQLSGFEDTAAYQWMLSNAYKYGFVLSYPKGNGYYIFEPWHWRYVGVKLATDLHNQKKNFYNLDQREIDTYLVSIFD